MSKTKKKAPSRLSLARASFARADPAAAAEAHTPEAIAASAREEHGGAGSQYIGYMVLGGLDGIITTFAVVSGVAGANLGANIVLILGLANLLADGFSMATGTYLSSKSEREYYEKERARESWEVQHFPDGERLELLAIYSKQGYPEADARRMVDVKSRDPKRWVDAMMVEELGLLPDDRTPLRSGLATFLAFVTAGSIPMMVYLVGLLTPISPGVAFPVSLAMSAVALFGLGAAKVVVTHRNPLRDGLETLVMGGLAALVAYVVGVLLSGIGRA
jgi:VIT1/CCC1 family predicted Fe2+/Mn2+ transporter